jgi:hypothetical protein
VFEIERCYRKPLSSGQACLVPAAQAGTPRRELGGDACIGGSVMIGAGHVPIGADSGLGIRKGGPEALRDSSDIDFCKCGTLPNTQGLPTHAEQRTSFVSAFMNVWCGGMSVG